MNSTVRWSGTAWLCENDLDTCPASYVAMVNSAISWYVSQGGNVANGLDIDEADTGNQRPVWKIQDTTSISAENRTVFLRLRAPNLEGNAVGENVHFYIRAYWEDYDSSPAYDDWDLPYNDADPNDPDNAIMHTHIYSRKQAEDCTEELRQIGLLY